MAHLLARLRGHGGHSHRWAESPTGGEARRSHCSGQKKKKPTFDLFWYVRSDLGVTMPDKRRLASSSHDIVNMRPPKQRSFSSANSTHGQPRPSSDPSCRIEHLHAWLGSLHALRSCRPRERMRLKHLLRRADDMLMRRSAGRDLG